MNMAKYVQSFQDRDDISDKLKTQLKVDCLLVTGSKESKLKACDAMFQSCNKVCTILDLIRLQHIQILYHKVMKKIHNGNYTQLFEFQAKTSIIRYEDITDPLGQAQVKLANNVLLFVKGCGWLTSVTLPNVQSIEERRASKVNEI